MRKLCVLLLLFTAVAAWAVPTRREAFAAIETLETNLFSEDALDASKVIMEFARDSTEVIFSVGPETLPWVSEEEGAEGKDAAVDSLLLAVYFAGNAKSQLLSDSTEDDPYSGWVAVIRAYRQFQARGRLVIPSIEELGELHEKGELLEHARAVKERERRSEQREAEAEAARNSV